MRLIDADTAIAHLVDMFDVGDDKALMPVGIVKALVRSVLSCMEPAGCGSWISVKDRMPEKQTPVLVYVPPYSDENEEYIGHVAMSYYTHFAHGGYWAGTDGNVYGAIGIIHDPTYWMPLPEPPKDLGA